LNGKDAKTGGKYTLFGGEKSNEIKVGIEIISQRGITLGFVG
jgi:hypothetical protein